MAVQQVLARRFARGAGRRLVDVALLATNEQRRAIVQDRVAAERHEVLPHLLAGERAGDRLVDEPEFAPHEVLAVPAWADRPGTEWERTRTAWRMDLMNSLTAMETVLFGSAGCNRCIHRCEL